MTVFWHKRFYFPIAKNKIFSLQLRSYCKKEATFLFSSQKSWRCFFTCAMVHWILKKWSYPSSKKSFCTMTKNLSFLIFWMITFLCMNWKDFHCTNVYSNPTQNVKIKNLKKNNRFHNIKDEKMLSDTIGILGS